MKSLPILLTLVALLAAGTAAKKDDLYRAGQRDIDAGRFTEAVEKFGQVARQGGAEADGALYWKAYSEHRAGRSRQALATLRELAGAHPKSHWLDDAKALETEIQGGSAGGGDDDNEETKLYALNGLLGSDPGRALPMLQKFLQGNHSQRLKEQALFVISQSGAPEARQTLLAIARGTAHPELQRKAIETLGIAGGEESARSLEEIYRAASRPEIKQAVIDAYLISNQRARIVAVARDGKDPLRGHAISTLGALRAKAELRQLYPIEASPETKGRILDALGVTGDVDTLADVARRDQDLTLRRKATQALGVAGGDKAEQALRSLYTAASDAATRRAVVEGLFIQNNARALIEIFRTEKDREIRREIVQHLTLMHSDEAEQFLEKVYQN